MKRPGAPLRVGGRSDLLAVRYRGGHGRPWFRLAARPGRPWKPGRGLRALPP